MDLTIRLTSKAGVDKYPAKSHARRFREKLGISSGIIVASGTNEANWPNSDMPAPFRQDRSFYYLTGCNEPGCSVSYDVEKDKLTLWLPPVDLGWHQLVYYGRGSTVEEALETYDIDEACYINEDPDSATANAEPLVHSHRSRTTSGRAHLQLFKLSPEDEQMLSKQTASEPDLLQRALNACRVIKDEHEIRLVRRANEISSEAHTNVLKGMHSFTNEAEIEAAYMQVCIARRAKEQAYDPIAGSGPNAAVLHYSANTADFGKGQTVVLDAGCEVERYASDVTRTIPINKHNPGHWPSKEARDIYELVERIQHDCTVMMKPGKKYIEANWHAHHLVVDGLLKLGILKGDANNIFHAGVSAAFLPHGLGHHVGLDVHDVSPDPHPPARITQAYKDRLRIAYARWNPQAAPSMSETDSLEKLAMGRIWHTSLNGLHAPVLEPGMIVTVEPGIYFNPVLLKELLKDSKRSVFVDEDVLKQYVPVGGVRIEDCILITKDGYENLTTAPKGDEMLKIIRESAALAGKG